MPTATPTVAAEIAALRASYQEAAATIARFDKIERDIGQGTLRHEAAYTLKQLRSAGPGLTEADLEPLSSYVSTLDGGEKTEMAVDALDEGLWEVAQDLFASLASLSAKGLVAVFLGAAAWLFGASSEAGEGAATILIGGGGGVVIGLGARELFRIFGEGDASIEGTWAWASSIGSRSEAAMRKPREIEKKLWERCAGPAPWTHRSLAARAQLWALAALGFFSLAVAFAATGFVIGFVQAWNHWQETMSSYGTLPVPFLA